jgi:O-acetyl-ADP-ribose deacetylase (regulator of RNase III)
MTPLDLAGWALALFAFALAVAAAGAVTVIFTRFLEEQRANLATHRAKQAQLAAEAKAAEQRAELEAADVLERRLALPFGGTRSLGEQLEARINHATQAIKQMQESQDAFARRLRTQAAQLTAVLEQRPAITHTDRPLRAEEES